MATYSDYAQRELDAASFAQDDKRRAAPSPPARRQRLPTVTVPRETELDDEIKEAVDDSYWDSEGESSAYHIRRHLAQRGLLIVEADKHSAALLRSQLVESTRAAITEITAERDALACDIAMRAHSLKLAYDIREALGWNKYTSLAIMPDEVRRLRRIVESSVATIKKSES